MSKKKYYTKRQAIDYLKDKVHYKLNRHSMQQLLDEGRLIPDVLDIPGLILFSKEYLDHYIDELDLNTWRKLHNC